MSHPTTGSVFHSVPFNRSKRKCRNNYSNATERRISYRSHVAGRPW